MPFADPWPEEVRDRVQEGIQKLCPMGTVISPDALKNLIGALADHLVLIVYGANRLDIDFGPEEMTIKTVWNKLKIMRPPFSARAVSRQLSLPRTIGGGTDGVAGVAAGTGLPNVRLGRVHE